MNNIKLLRDWIAFCQGDKYFDESHFFTLFMEQPDQAFCEEVFFFFDCKEELMQRAGEFISLPDQVIEEAIDDETFLQKVKQHVADKRTLCLLKNHMELANYLETDNYQFVNSFGVIMDHKLQGGVNGGVSDLCSDLITSSYTEPEDMCFALKEAFYGYTHSLEAIWSMTNPLYDLPVSFESFGDIHRTGDYVVLEDRILLARRN